MIRVLLPLAALLFAGMAWAGTDAESYARACREAIAEIPEFSCADGAIVPVTVDGKPVPPSRNLACDRPALLSNEPYTDGQCVHYSRILSLSTKKAQIAAMCRQKKIRRADSLDYDEIDVIAHSPESGATCWFQAKGKDEKPVQGAHVPSPTKDAAGSYWNPPNVTVKEQCGACHDSGPFMFSPFVGQVWNHMPVDPLGPYYHVDPDHLGFDQWPRVALAPRDNACIGCHRIGVGETCGNLTAWMTGRSVPKGADSWARRFPGSHPMPPGLAETEESWNRIYGRSVDQIISCCHEPGQQSCNASKIEAWPHG